MSQTLTTELSLDAIRPITRDVADGDRHTWTVDGGFSLRPQEAPGATSKNRTIAIIAILTGTTLVSSFSTGLLTVGLPRMARDLNLPANLLLWYKPFSHLHQKFYAVHFLHRIILRYLPI